MLSVFLFLIALSSCTLTPEDKLIQDLAPKLTEIDTPSNIHVTNDSQNHVISVTWDPVENATYYIVEYQETSVYQGSDTDVFLQVIRNTNSFDLNVPKEQDRDKRYVFRIRAVCLEKNTAGQVFNELESDWTELYEGVIADYLTVTYVKQDNVVTVFESVSNVTSLDNKNLVDIEVRYFKHDYSDQDVFDDSWEEIDVDGIKLESNQSYSLTAVLFVNDAPVVMTGLEICGDIDYTQPSVTDLTAVNNDKTSISLSWNAVQAAAGVEADVRYAIQRKASNEESWSYITVSAEDDSPLLLEDTEYVDENVVSNVSYAYRVLTTYVLHSDGSVLIQNSSAASYIEDCHLIDTRPERFTAQVISEEEQGDEFVLKVKLSVDPLHDDIFTCENFSYIITRHESGSDKTVTSAHIKTSEYVDTITLSSEDHRLPHTYYYTIEYFYDEELISTETITALNHNNDEPFFHEVEGTLPSFEFINSFSLESEVPLAGKIPLKWMVSIPEGTNFTQENLKVTLTRRNVDSVEVETLLDKSLLEAGNYFTDIAAKIGSVYEYQLIVTYVDESSEYNGVFERSEYIEASVLSYPSNLTATVNESSENIELSWTPVEHASGYVINYKVKNSEQPLTKTIDGGDTSKAQLTANEVTAGLVYEISIQSKDKEGNSTDASPSVEGSILGPVPLTVENGVDEIKISWEPGENINIYSIRIKNESGAKFDPIPVSGSTTEYILNADNLPESILAGSDYPLSEKYYFAVIPNDINIDEDSIGYAEGYWLRPPKEINATKSEYRDNIRISWEKVDDKYTYILYKRAHGTEEPWEFVEYVFPSDTSEEVAYYYVTTDEEYDFTVASVSNGKEGLVQNVFKADVNYGYPLMKPKRFGATDLGTNPGQFRIYFERVKGATEYIVNLDVIGEIIVKESESGEITATSSNYSNYEIRVETDESGMINLYLPEIPLEELRQVTWNVSVAARNTGIEDSSRNTTEATIITKNYNPEGMNQKDYATLAISVLQNLLVEIDSRIGHDWWQGLWSNEHYEIGVLDLYTCSGSVLTGDLLEFDYRYMPENPGYIEFNGIIENNIEFNNISDTAFNFWCAESGAGGETEDNPLERAYGKVNVVFPLGIYENIQLTFNDYYVKGTGGTVTVSYLDKSTGEVIDGSAKTFNANELNVSLL